MNDAEDVVEISMYQACLLHARADRVLRGIVSEQLETFDTTMMEWLLLGAVGSGPKEGISLSNIALTLDVSQPQVTALLNKVADRRLVRQKIQRHDRRSRHLLLTARGRRLLAQIENTINEAMRFWLDELPPEQLKAYIQTVNYISENRPD